MKKLTSKDVYELLNDEVIELPTHFSRSEQYGNNSIIVDQDTLSTLVPNYPASLIGNNKITLPKNYVFIMKHNNNLKDHIVLLKEWTDAETTINDLIEQDELKNIYYYSPEITELVQVAQEKYLQLSSILYLDVWNKNIFEKDFWDFFRPKQSSSVSKATSILSKLFDNSEDVLHYQDLLDSKSLTNTLKTREIQHLTFLKALKNVPDYSLDKVPQFLIEQFKSRNEGIKIIALKALKKYSFDLVKDLFLQEYKTFKKPKFTNFLEAILEEKNCLQKKSFNDLLIGRENETIYQTTICLDFSVLKKLANNDGFLAETLASIYTRTFSKHYKDLTCYTNEKEATIYFAAKSSDKKKIDNFEQTLLKDLEFTYSPLYLDSDKPYNIRLQTKLSRICYENYDNVIDDYRKKITKWHLHNSLEQQLEQQPNNSRRNKL